MPAKGKKKREKGVLKSISIKYKVLIVIVMVQLPLFLFYFSYSREITNNVNEQLAKGYAESLSLFCSSMEEQFMDGDEFLNVDFYGGVEYHLAAEATTVSAFYLFLQQEKDNLNQFLTYNNFVSAVIFYHEGLACTKSYFNSASEYTGEQVQQFYEIIARPGEEHQEGWVLYQEEGAAWMMRCLHYGKLRCALVVNLNYITKSSQLIYKLSTPVIFFKNGEAVTEALWVRQYQREGKLLKEAEAYQILQAQNTTYLVVSENTLTLKASYAVPYVYDWGWLYLALWVLIAIILLTFGMAGVYLYFTFFKPLNRLIHVMNEIKNGNVQARASYYHNSEFDQINKIFNQMVDKMENLKILAYENQIKAKRSQLDALRLQIRRHFFLNCLKIIFAMAESGDVYDVQEVVLLLSDYLRYTLDINENLVPLKKELQMCENYIQLQGISKSDKPRMAVSVDAELAELHIPAVSILTLIENCCKYGASQDKALQIDIEVNLRRIGEDAFVDISIQDNGPGFSEEMLAWLNTTPDIYGSKSIGHVGILNVVARFRMIYGADCSAIFSNYSGARIELIFALNGGTVR